MKLENQHIHLPQLNDLGWVFKFFKFVWIAVLLSIALQFLLSFTSVYSVEALNIAASVVDEGQDLNTESLLYQWFIPKDSSPSNVILISCLLAIVITAFSTILEIVIAWTISWNQSILNRVSTPQIISTLIDSNTQDEIKSEESTIVQRWLILRSISDFFHNVLANSIGSIFNLIILVAFTYFQSVMAGHCLVGIIILWFTILYFLSPIVLKKSQEFAALEEIVGKGVRSSVSLSDALKPIDIKNRFLKYLIPDIKKYSRAINSLGVWGSILYGSLSGLASLAPILVVVLTIFLTKDSGLSITTAATLYLYASKISTPLTTIGRVIPILQNHRIDFVRFRNAFDDSQKENSNNRNNIDEFSKMKFEDIAIKYKGGKQLFFSPIEVRKGELTCLAGKSGVGKTTLLKLISGRYDNPVQVMINDSIEIFAEDLIDDIAYLAQEPKLAEMTIAENLLLFSNTKNISNPQLANIFSVLILNLNKQEDTYVSSDVQGLSVGQRRAISLINVLNSNKPIIILDEPLSNLDSNLKEQVWEVIQTEKNNRIFIISLHEDKYINMCDKIINL